MDRRTPLVNDESYADIQGVSGKRTPRWPRSDADEDNGSPTKMTKHSDRPGV